MIPYCTDQLRSQLQPVRRRVGRVKRVRGIGRKKTVNNCLSLKLLSTKKQAEWGEFSICYILTFRLGNCEEYSLRLWPVAVL